MSDLSTGNGKDDLDFVGGKPARSAGLSTDHGAFFGCPLSWIKKVAPLVHGKGELLVAIYLWRLREWSLAARRSCWATPGSWTSWGSIGSLKAARSAASSGPG